MANLTAVDVEVLSKPPSGWFSAEHLPFNRPMYRCERLEQLGKLQSRVLGAYPNIYREYKRLDGKD